MAQAKYQQGLELLEKQQLAGALRLLGESLTQEETGERWNDWAVAQFTAGQLIEAEHAFRYALELDPENREVSGNLGVLLVECQRENDEIPFLASALADSGGSGSGTADVLRTNYVGPELNDSGLAHPQIVASAGASEDSRIALCP
jgi:predicted Zn-dependent protease